MNGICITENCSGSITVRKASDVVLRVVGDASSLSGAQTSVFWRWVVLTSSTESLEGDIDLDRRVSEELEDEPSVDVDGLRCCGCVSICWSESTLQTCISP